MEIVLNQMRQFSKKDSLQTTLKFKYIPSILKLEGRLIIPNREKKTVSVSRMPTDEDFRSPLKKKSKMSSAPPGATVLRQQREPETDFVLISNTHTPCYPDSEEGHVLHGLVLQQQNTPK